MRRAKDDGDGSADGQAVARLSTRLRGAVTRYFQRRRFDPDEAEDAAQEVFLRLSRRVGLAEIANPEGYLFETAASVAVDHARRRRARGGGSFEPYDDARHAVPDLGPDRLLESREALTRLADALHALPERTRHVVVLARLEHLPHAEIARRLGVSVSAVEKHLVRGLARLAAEVGEAR